MSDNPKHDDLTGKPLVSVIIASYNHAPYIEASIRSVLAQSYPNIELLVVDDGSKDDSVERIRVLQAEYDFDFQRQSNQGLSRTLNAAIVRAKGSIIVPFGSDDIMRPERIAKQVAYLHDKPEVGICSANIDFIDAQGNPFPDSEQKLRHLPFRRLDFDDLFLDRKPGPQAATLMFRREALEAVGGFDPDIRLEDVYICLKILRAGFYIDILGEVLADYRKHESNTYKHLRFMTDNMLKTYACFSDHPSYEAVTRRYLVSMFLKASNRDKPLARELIRQIPVRYWNAKVVRGALRLLFA
ncbi:glycosyltransferase [Pseudomonas sp. MDMC216]|jgi:alpha-1,3-rhamnosyltransferase|uniref:Alpha-1,3-rhamnosyltransferase n=1 Tax=Ectopseudomonas chengduensis TaxID=489632 RepID=A0A1G6JRT6_9GAMM|nr:MULTISPECIES: glycosyltransferase [Pseudomonas]KJU76095.1 glycosyl transferase [Pseudomonas oleovorans]MBA4681407.1 glycosyltransferase [Pseudomonas sp.]MBJ7546535.1 glycosyltransferase [Pseudomonas sp. OA3]KQO44322.1 glycosyl transferase [Pseudomonas sp. Leaf83]MBG0848291.1 glycosyltransferase [Pseudomonas chengduensis]